MTAPHPTATTSSTGLQPNVAGALSYLLGIITGVLFLVIEKENRFVRFHAAQSITAFGVVACLIFAFGALALASLPLLPAAFNLFLWAAVAPWAVEASPASSPTRGSRCGESSSRGTRRRAAAAVSSPARR